MKQGQNLIDGKFVVVYFDLVKSLGWSGSVLLQQIHFWTFNDRDRDVEIDAETGRRWIRVSYEDMAERLEGVLSIRQLQRLVAKLRDAGVLDVVQDNGNPYDRTSSYAVNPKAVAGIQGVPNVIDDDDNMSGSMTTETAASKTTEAAACIHDDGSGGMFLMEEPSQNDLRNTRHRGTTIPATQQQHQQHHVEVDAERGAVEVMRHVVNTTGRPVTFDKRDQWIDLAKKWGVVPVMWAIDKVMEQKVDPWKKASSPAYVAKVVESYAESNVVQLRVDDGVEQVEFRTVATDRGFVQERREPGGVWEPVDLTLGSHGAYTVNTNT